MEVVKTENLKEEMTDIKTSASIQVGSEDCVLGLNHKCDIPDNEVGLVSLKYEKDIKEEITSLDSEVQIKTETNEIKDDMEFHELSYELLDSIKFENYKTERNGNEYMGPTAAKRYVSLNKFDLDHGQYVSDMEAIKDEQNVGKEYTHVIEVDMEKQKIVQQYQPTYFKDKTGNIEEHCTLKTNVERHKSLPPASEVEDKSTQRTRKGNVKYFKCQFCEYITKRMHDLKMHFKLKHSENAELYQCFNCEYKTNLKKNLAKHCRILHNKEVEWQQCNLCGFKTKYKSSLLSHNRSKHGDLAEIFRCELCNFKTKNKYYFLQHHKFKHDDAAEVYHCELCDFKT